MDDEPEQLWETPLDVLREVVGEAFDSYDETVKNLEKISVPTCVGSPEGRRNDPASSLDSHTVLSAARSQPLRDTRVPRGAGSLSQSASAEAGSVATRHVAVHTNRTLLRTREVALHMERIRTSEPSSLSPCYSRCSSATTGEHGTNSVARCDLYFVGYVTVKRRAVWRGSSYYPCGSVLSEHRNG